MLELIPDRAAVCRDQTTTLYVLVRITPTPLPPATRKPRLNLALALDRSGSMQGERIALTRQAAAQVVAALTPDDVISIVLFNDRVETVLERARVTDKHHIVAMLERLEAEGGTALFEAWETSSALALAEADATRLNRVILLTDGEANRGETQSGVVSWYVRKVAEQGVQTTTLGFGEGYNEELLRSMASHGDGNHFYVETNSQLARSFEMELAGLLETQGTRVRLKLEAMVRGSQLEWMAEVEAGENGQIKLADLVSQSPLSQLVRLRIPPQQKDTNLRATLSYHSPVHGCQQSLETLLILPTMKYSQRQTLAPHPDIQVQVATALASQARRQAMDHLRAGHENEALKVLQHASDIPGLSDDERASIDDLWQTLQRGEHSSGHKKAAMYGHGHSHGRICPKPKD